MEHEGRNEAIRQKLLDEIGDIEAFILHRKIDDLLNDRMCQKAIVMSLINIGELSKSFTEDYLAARPEIPWKAIRGFRNIAPPINTGASTSRMSTRPSLRTSPR